MWGAEMGANEAGVVIGNEAVWDRLSDDSNDLIPRLLGMDLLRLGLERSRSACEALDVIVGLLEKYGQGGDCSDIISNFSYHNTFLIADSAEAWVLETADRLWAAEKVVSGCRNISNCMSITTKIDKCSNVLMSFAQEKGWWDGTSVFNWCRVIGGCSSDLENPNSRWTCGKQLLQQKSKDGKFTVTDMMDVLRDEGSGINMAAGSFCTTGSQVSVLGSNPDTGNCHWFTGTAGPSCSLFKPFIFCADSSSGMGELTVSPVGKSLSPKQRQHHLWTAHLNRKWTPALKDLVCDLEKKCISSAEGERNKKEEERTCLFGSAVRQELELYELVT